MNRVVSELVWTVLPFVVVAFASYYWLQINRTFATTIFTSSFIFLSFLLVASSFLYTSFIEYVQTRHSELAQLVTNNRKNDFETLSKRVKARLDRPQRLTTTILRSVFLTTGALSFSLLASSSPQLTITTAGQMLDIVRLFSTVSLAFMILTVVNVLYFLITLSTYAKKRITSLLQYIHKRTTQWPETKEPEPSELPEENQSQVTT